MSRIEPELDKNTDHSNHVEDLLCLDCWTTTQQNRLTSCPGCGAPAWALASKAETARIVQLRTLNPAVQGYLAKEQERTKEELAAVRGLLVPIEMTEAEDPR